MKKTAIVLFAIVLLAAAMVLTACSNPAKSQAPGESMGQAAGQESGGKVTEITYTHLGDWAKPGLEKAAKDFEAETGIKVNLQFFPFQDAYEKYLTLIQSDTMPDAGMGFSDFAGEFYERGAILPLEDLISQEYKADIQDSLVEMCTYKGHLAAVPFAMSVRMPMYRADVFEREGIKAPKTTSDLLAAAQVLYNPPEMYGYGLCSARNKNSAEFYMELLWPMGGELMNEDDTKVAFNSPEGIEAMKLFLELAKTAPEGYQTSDIYLGENAFTAGNLALINGGMWVVPPLMEANPEAEVGYVPKLTGPGGHSGNLIIADFIYVFDNKDSARAKAAMEWIEFFKSDEAYLGKSFVEYGFAPDLKSHSGWEFMQNETADVVSAAAECGKGYPLTPAWPQISDALSVAVGKVCAGQATPEEALDEAEKLCNEAIENSY